MQNGIIILLVCIFVIIIMLVLSIVMASKVARPRYFTIEEARQIEKNLGVYGSYDSFAKTDYTINSFDGYVLHATFIPCDILSPRYVIISHGFGYNRMGSVKYVNMFRSLGYNCVIYDNRGHGENIRVPNTMGKKEHKDLLSVISDTRIRYTNIRCLGLHGESMGSALSVMALGDHPAVDFLVSDCGYADLPKLLGVQVKKQFHFPASFVHVVSIVSGLLYGFRYGEVIPYESLANNKIPVLFIHGLADTFIDPEHCHIMYDHDPGNKQIYLVTGADHAQSYQTDPESYKKAVSGFLATLPVQKELSL